MKILVTFASVGSGHYKAAEALYNYLKAHTKAQVVLVDALDKTPFIFKRHYEYSYLLMVKYLSGLWQLGFRITSAAKLQRLTRPLAAILNTLPTKRFAQYLTRENPDVIVSTHFLPSETAAILKMKRKIHARVCTIITDYGAHPYWITRGTDMYMVASEYTKHELLRQGVKEKRIMVCGIPINVQFLKQFEKNRIREKLGLRPDDFTVLISTGSFGIGRIDRLVMSLCRQAQVIVVCAYNKRLYARLTGRCYPNTTVFGHVENIHELMAASDIIITKPGGLTISESLAMDLVPLFMVSIPGQETENMKYLASYGVGIHERNIGRIKELVVELKHHPERLQRIKMNISTVKKPFAVMEIADAVCKGRFRAPG